MVLSEAVLTLAGFVLAHAAFNVSELPKGQLLSPFVVVEQNAERELTRFDDRNPVEAVSKARDFIQLLEEKVDAWAMARQGIVTIDGRELDVIVVEYWSRGMPESQTIMQEIRPPARRVKFKLIGQPFVLIDGEIQESSQVEDSINIIMMGIEEHSQAAPLWTQWKNRY